MEPNTDLIIGGHDRPSSRSIALDSIIIDESVQARAKMIAEVVVDEYADAMRQGAAFPPVDVFQEGETYILADGFTRHAAAKRAGLAEIGCVVHAGDLRDAKLFGVGANATHGHPRSAADKRCAVLKLLKDAEWCKWSDREIARHCRVGHQLVAELRPLTGRATSERRYRSKHGSVGKMKTDGIGKASRRRALRSGGLVDQSDLPASSTNNDATQTTPHTAEIIETEAAAVSAIYDTVDVGELGQVYADQQVDQDEALAMVVEFAQFVIAHTSSEGTNVIVTITDDDADLFHSLRNRAEEAIGTRAVAYGELSH
jgi:ParB-like nuclease domain